MAYTKEENFMLTKPYCRYHGFAVFIPINIYIDYGPQERAENNC